MDAERVERLEALGIVWNFHDAAWDDNLAKFEAETEPDASGLRHVSRTHVTADGVKACEAAPFYTLGLVDFGDGRPYFRDAHHAATSAPLTQSKVLLRCHLLLHDG